MTSAATRCRALRPDACKRILAGLAFAVAIASPAYASDPVVWKDWMAGCDQAKQCRALAMPSEAAENGLILIIDRASGPDAQLTVKLTTAAGMQAGPVRLTIDGVPYDGRTKRDADSAVWDGEGALQLARALAAGRQADATQAEKPLGQVSLSGAAAALFFVDDVQARVGTKGALVRPGRKPDVAEANVRPTILPYAGLRTAPAPASLAAELRRHGVLKGEDCGQSTTPSDGVYALDTTHTLVLLECGSGAYNLVQRAFLVLGGKAPTAQPVAGELGDGLANADFDPRYRTLGGLAKGRGAGDCGTIDRWVWTGKGFLRVQRSVMAVCRGVPPQWWITVERSAIAVAL